MEADGVAAKNNKRTDSDIGKGWTVANNGHS